MNDNFFKKISFVFLMSILVFFVYYTAKAEEINKEQAPDKQKESALLELQLYKYEKQEKKNIKEMIKELILNVENYYENDFIDKNWVRESLVKDLNKAILGLDKINSLYDSIWFIRKKNAQEKLVILSLEKVVFKIRLYNNYIDNDLANYIIKNIEEIEEVIKEFGI